MPLLTMKLPLASTESAQVMFPSGGQGEIRQTGTRYTVRVRAISGARPTPEAKAGYTQGLGYNTGLGYNRGQGYTSG